MKGRAAWPPWRLRTETWCRRRLAVSRKRMLRSARSALEVVGRRELMEEIRGEGGKHVMKCGPESLSNLTRAVVTAAGLSGGAPAPQEQRRGWIAQARPGPACTGCPTFQTLELPITHSPRLPTAAKCSRSPGFPRLLKKEQPCHLPHCCRLRMRPLTT